MKNEYRVVSDRFCGFEVQCRRWWFPLWLQCGVTNTHRSLEEAEKYAEKHARGQGLLVKYLGRLPVNGTG